MAVDYPKKVSNLFCLPDIEKLFRHIQSICL